MLLGATALLILAGMAACYSLGGGDTGGTAAIDPATGVQSGAEPFSLDVGGPACLLLHGFEVTPQIFRELAEHLAREGISSRAILLPGHGTTIDALAECRAQDWVDASERAYEELRREYDTVWIVGFSIGGTIAVDLAERRDVDGLVLLAPFFRVTRRWTHLVSAEGMTRFADRLGFPEVVRNIPLDVADEEARERVIHAGRTPIATARSLFDFADRTREAWASVTCPVLVLHARDDRVADPDLSEAFLRTVASTDTRFVLLEKSKHLLPIDFDKERVFEETAAFIRARTPPGARGR